MRSEKVNLLVSIPVLQSLVALYFCAVHGDRMCGFLINFINLPGET